MRSAPAPLCTCGLRVVYLEILRSHCRHIRDTKHKADRVQNIRFTAAVEASDRVETLIPWVKSALPDVRDASGITYQPEMTVRTAYDLKPCRIG